MKLLAAILLTTIFASPHSTPAQTADSAAATLPQFAAATIKPPGPKGGDIAGFYSFPGGRVVYGGNVEMLIEYAFHLQSYQVAGGPDWAHSERFDIKAIPSDDSPSRKVAIGVAMPSPEQRQMLQALLRDRFGLKFHMETKNGEVYLLTRGHKNLQFNPPKDPAADPRATLFFKSTGIDGEAVGINTTTDYLAERLGSFLQLPVLNQTGITGSYDFNLPPLDSENLDLASATISVVDRLGLAIKRSRGPIQTLVIDHADHPNAD